MNTKKRDRDNSFRAECARRAQNELERQTVEYYKSLTPEEIEEDRLWVRFASEQAMQRWDNDDKRLLQSFAPNLIAKNMPPIHNSEDWRKLGHYFKFNGHQIFCVDLGPVDAPAILFLHGFPTSSFDFYRLVPELASSFRLILPDFLGFGFSDKPAAHRYSIFAHADVIEKLAESRQLKNCFLLTHDMGNSVGLELLRRRTLPIQRYLMLNGGMLLKYYQPVFSQRLLQIPLVGEIFSRLISYKIFAQQFSSIFAPDKIPAAAELHELWQIMNYNNGKRNYAKLIRYIKERKTHESEWLEALRASRAPFKMVWGQQDPVAVPIIGRALREYRPDATLVEVFESGHYPQLEVPEIVLREMRSFFVGETTAFELTAFEKVTYEQKGHSERILFGSKTRA